MYSNPSFSTPFSVKDILSWSEQQAHYGMDFNSYNMNMNSAYYGYDTPRHGDQMNSVSQMSPMINNLAGNSCLYSSNNSSPSLQPTYTNLTYSTPVSSMTALSSTLQLPVHLEGMSPKNEPYDTNNAPTPGSEHDHDLQAGSQHMPGVPPPPNLEPGTGLPGNPSSNLQNPQLKVERTDDHILDSKGWYHISNSCLPFYQKHNIHSPNDTISCYHFFPVSG